MSMWGKPVREVGRQEGEEESEMTYISPLFCAEVP